MGCTCVSFLMIYLFFIHCFLTDYKLSKWMGQGILNKNSICDNWYHSIHEAFMELIKMIKSHEYYGAKLRVLLKIIDTDSQSIIIISACVAHSYCQITKHQVAWQFKFSQIQTYSWLISFSYAIILLFFCYCLSYIFIYLYFCPHSLLHIPI